MVAPSPVGEGWEGGPPRRRHIPSTGLLAVLLIGLVGAAMLGAAVGGRSAEVVATPPAPVAPAPPQSGPLPTAPAALPAIAGTWSPVDLPGPPSATGVQSAAWTGDALVVADGPSVHVRSDGRDAWDPLPDLPADAVRSGAQLTAVGEAIAVVAQRRRTPASGAAIPYAWVLGAGGWAAVDGGPAFASPLGVVGGRLVVQDDRSDPEAQGGQAALWSLRPDPPGWTALPDPPTGMTGLHAVEVDGRLLLLGLISADGGTSRPAAALLRGGAWEVLADPPASTYGTPAVADGTVVGAVQLPGGMPALALLDVAADRWTTRPIPTDGGGAAIGYPPAAWDGADMVWLHGGIGTTVHLALDLRSGQLARAQAGSDEVGPLVWDGVGLLRWGYGLTGPFGVHRWTPAG